MTDTTAAAQAKKLNQVRALLAKAEAEGCTREEAEALTAKATELMAKYGIERAMLAAEDPRSDELADFQFDVEGAYTDATATLIHGIAKAFRCQTIQLSGTRGGRMHIFGFKSDLERVEIMFTSLDLQMVNALLHDVPDGTANIDSVSRGYCFAYASAVVARLQERERVARREAESKTTGTELVLVRREDQVRDSFRAAYPRTRVARSSWNGSAAGKAYAAAQRADLGSASVRGKARAAIG
jgi:hypothetical protein